MRYIADLHVHSRYSRACSQALTFPNIAAWCRAKGIDIVATADFTHPAWFQEIGRCLDDDGSGLLRLRRGVATEAVGEGKDAAPSPVGGRDVRFVLSTEIACIYKQGGKTRRLHLVLLMPSVDSVRRLNAKLEAGGFNLRSDGRPILGMSAKELLKTAKEIDVRAEIIPAHVWTPWFAVFGSMSGFDSLEECFEELTPEIHAVETGLSSDPAMNRRLSALDDIALVSSSDAHGLHNLGREANVFDFSSPSYDALIRALRPEGRESFLYTIEFFPEEGKYHADGHADCGFRCGPEETERFGGRCPKCGRLITRGVLGRVHSLADRPVGEGMEGHVPFRSVVPLEEAVAAAAGKGKTSKAVQSLYRRVIAEVGPEFDVLLDAPFDGLAAVDRSVAEAVRRVRAGEISVSPGYDGLYGEISLFPDRKGPRQSSLDV